MMLMYTLLYTIHSMMVTEDDDCPELEPSAVVLNRSLDPVSFGSVIRSMR